MIRVLANFYDGESHTLFLAGAEIADDPRLAYAEKRGLVEHIPEKEEVPKKPVKKATTKKK